MQCSNIIDILCIHSVNIFFVCVVVFTEARCIH